MARLNKVILAVLALGCLGGTWIASPGKGSHAAVGGGSPPSFDAASSTSAIDVSTISWSHTCTGTNRVLIVQVAVGTASFPVGTVSSATYNGVAMTAIPSSKVNDGTWTQTEGWYLVNPASGTNTVTVNFPGAGSNPRQVFAGAISFTAANQSGGASTLGTAATNTAGAGSPSVTVTSATSQMVVACAITDGENSLTIAGTGTQRWKVQNLDGDTDAGGSTDAGAASVTMQWTATSTIWSMWGVGVKGL